LLAQDRDLGRRVAIKRPFKTALEDGLARFQVEARAATLRHPNIPAVYEMGEQDGLPFIAMEFVEGEALDKIIASKKPMTLIEKLSIIEQVCSALGHAHEKNIVHRDIKPANVIVQADGVAKIIDFGIAKILSTDGSAGLTQSSQIIGSLHYIAPERFKGETVDGRADIFSTGVMLYLLLTGHLPFAGGEETASYKIVNESHTTLGTYLHDYPPALDGILEQAMAKNPNLRYSTAEDFGDDLHNVIAGLKEARVGQLLEDAERLTMESRYSPALDLLQEATKLDPDNTQVKKMRRFVREHLDRSKRAERVRELIRNADEALIAENFQDALTALKEAQSLDPTSTGLGQRIQVAEEKKRLFEKSTAALAGAVSARDRGDLTGALRFVEKALQEDVENAKLLAARDALAKEAESQALQGKLLQLLETARGELAQRHFSAIEGLLCEAEEIDPSHPEIDRIRREVVRFKEQEERRQLLEEIKRRVNEFLRADKYEQATDLISRALDRMPTEAVLHRLKAEVEAGASKFQAKRFVDEEIAKARDLFATSPEEALALLQKAIEQVPDEERLISYAQSLREQFDTLRMDRQLDDTLRTVRALLAEKQFDKAIGILESFRVEFGSQPDVDELLKFATDELSAIKRRSVVERCLNQARALIEAERLDDAILLLEVGVRDTSDASLARLLEEVRAQQVAIARKLDVLQKRVALLRERAEFDEAIQHLQEYLATAPKSVQVQELLTKVIAERQQRQITVQAIAVAKQALQKREFAAGLEALHTVIGAYGESPELTRGVVAIENARVAYSQDLADKSIEAARAALLKKDAESALADLKSASEYIGFTDAKRQADWQRLLQAVKKALPNATVEMPSNAMLLAPQRSMPAWLVAGVGLILVAVIGFVVWKVVLPLMTAEAHIVITKGTPGATVKIDGAVVGTIDAKGSDLSVKVAPSQAHHIEVSKNSFLTISDDRKLEAGETYAAPFTLPPAPTNPGNLKVHGNVSPVKVYIDGDFRGSFEDGGVIQLGAGPHTVHYAANGYTDSPEKDLTIGAGLDLDDTFNLAKDATVPSNVGNLKIETTPLAHVSVDGKSAGTANANGSLLIPNLTPTHHVISVSLDGFQPLSGKAVTIAAGQTQVASALLTALPATLVSFQVDPTQIDAGKTATLSWKVNNAATVTIDGVGAFNTPSGTATVSPTQSTKYRLNANGVFLAETGVIVNSKTAHSEPKTPGADTPTKTPSSLPSKAALVAALGGYQDVFKRASGGKDTQGCQTALTGSYGGKLKGLANWCALAKSFQVSESCSDPSGSAQFPTMTCAERIHITRKDTDPKDYNLTKTFQFSKGADGSWQLSTFD
jgi:serine/threonine-protein kinase